MVLHCVPPSNALRSQDEVSVGEADGLLDRTHHGAAAQDDVAGIDHDGLAGGDAAFWFVEDELERGIVAARRPA